MMMQMRSLIPEENRLQINERIRRSLSLATLSMNFLFCCVYPSKGRFLICFPSLDKRLQRSHVEDGSADGVRLIFSRN